MVVAGLIAFREGLEASLIIGIVFGYLKKTGQTGHYRYAWVGVLTAIVASFALAIGIHLIGAELEGQAGFLQKRQPPDPAHESYCRDLVRTIYAGAIWDMLRAGLITVERARELGVEDTP